MADEIIVEPTTDKAEIEKQNLETIRKQGEQDLSGHSTASGIDVEASAGSALDQLRNAAIAQQKVDAGEPTEPTEAEKKAAADKAAAEEAAKKAASNTQPTPGATPTDAEKAAADKAAAEAARAEEIQKKSDEIFKSAPSLPPNASPRSGESFAAVKRIAAEQITDLSRQLEESKKSIAELTAKTQEPVPKEITQELETLREFRAKLDIELDPKWKQFDSKISESNEFIYAQLKKVPAITDAVIADIKKYGGPAYVNMEKILATVTDPTIKRIVETKLADIEMTDYQKSQAIEKAKADVKKYQEERSKEWEQSLTAHNTSTKKAMDDMTAKIPWLNKITVDPKLDEAKRKQAEAHNQYAETMRKQLDEASQDDSAEMRALLLVGMVNSFRFEDALKAETAAHTASKEQLTTIEAKHKKEVDDLTATITRLKAAGTSRLRTSAAPAGGGTPPPAEPSVNETAGSALDRLRQQKIEAARTT